MSIDPAPAETTTSSDSSIYGIDTAASRHFPRWLKVSAIAAVSVLAGGLAASWYYRQALSRMRQAEQNPYDSDFGIEGEGTYGED